MNGGGASDEFFALTGLNAYPPLTLTTWVPARLAISLRIASSAFDFSCWAL